MPCHAMPCHALPCLAWLHGTHVSFFSLLICSDIEDARVRISDAVFSYGHEYL